MRHQPLVPSWCCLVRSFDGKTAQQIAGRWENVLNPHLVKGSWTRDEDLKILAFVEANGPGNWVKLAVQLPGRIGKQCRERWTNHLCPKVVKGQWTPHEDDLLIELHHQFGNQWTKIAACMPGRTDNCVKNRWNSTLKKRLERLVKGEPIMKKRGRKPKVVAACTSDVESDCTPPNEKIELPPIATITLEGFAVPLKRLPRGTSQGSALDVRSLMNPIKL
jgi:hypothetical protein